PEVLFRRDVAQHGGAVPADHGCANRGSDVIVARSNVRNQGTERIEWSFLAKLALLIYLLLDLVHGHVAWALDHDLNVVLPGFLGQFTERSKFGKLRFIAGVRNASRPESIAQRKRHIVLAENFADVVKVF